MLRDVFASAQHLLGIVNDILDLARIEADRMTLHLEDVNPRLVLDSTLPIVAVQAASKSIELQDETVHMAMPLIRADEVRLRQVLLNLLSNAVKFTPAAEHGRPQGRVTLRARVLDTAGPDAPAFLRIEVEDTGIGVPPEKREAIFEKFVQVDSSHTRRHSGSGLGLTIARRLVELMGGEIGLEEGSSRGTRVWFTVPLYPAAARAGRGAGLSATEPASG